MATKRPDQALGLMTMVLIVGLFMAISARTPETSKNGG